MVEGVWWVGGLDAAGPYYNPSARAVPGAEPNVAETIEFWSFVALIVLIGATLLFRKYLQKK